MYSTILLTMLMSMVGANVFADEVTNNVSLIDNGDMEGTDAKNFAKRENFGPVVYDIITDGVGVDGSRGVKVVSVGGQTGSWETQFYIISNEVLYEGDKVHVSFDYRADGGGIGVTAYTQAHFAPGDYQHWDVIGTPTFTADWQTYDKTVVIDASMAGTNGLKTIAFSLAENTTDGAYYFDNVVFEIEKENQQQGIKINEENFPDAGFRNYLRSQSYGQDGILTEDEINGITNMTVGFKGISSLQGIEYFTALTYLYCTGNYLTSLDVSKNTALEWLMCDNNRLTSLDVSGSTALTHLTCFRNPLTSLDASGCTALTWLECPDNQLTSLDVSGCTALTDLSCSFNQLTILNVSGCTALTNLSCSYNQLTSLDVSSNPALTSLSCGGNQLTSLDVSKNTALTKLYCFQNQLTSLDVSSNPALTYLDCSSNQLTSLDVSKNTALTYLDCSSNQLTSLNVSGSTALSYLDFFDNRLTSLDVSGCAALTRVYCQSNQIKGEAMDALISSLPQNMTDEMYVFGVYNVNDPDEGNVCTKTQVAAAKEKGWIPSYYNADVWGWLEYEGSDEGANVNAIQTEKHGKTAIYTLDGKRLSTTNAADLPSGIYIINGKKVVVK